MQVTGASKYKLLPTDYDRIFAARNGSHQFAHMEKLTESGLHQCAYIEKLESPVCISVPT